MKKINVIILVLTLVLNSIVNVQTLIARNRPPAPRGGGFDDGAAVGGAIDNYLILLIAIALIFGTLAINNYKMSKPN